MKFNIKDINYIGIIIALLIALFALNIEHKKEYQWCDYFYDKYGKDM